MRASKRTGRWLILGCALAAGLLGWGALETQRPGPGPARPLNVLLITADDLGPELGVYGDVVAATPRLDQLAQEGVWFTRAYTTQASCSPSRASMLTSLYPHQNGQVGLAGEGYGLNGEPATIPSLLKAAGYRTGIIGKLHVEPKELLPFDWNGASSERMRDVAFVARKAEGFLRESRERPFFLMVSYIDPHWPFDRQVKGVPAHPFRSQDVVPFPWQALDTREVRKRLANYYSSVARLDQGVGLLLDALERTGHAEDTLVIFVGDQGPGFSRSKTTCYEAGLAIPFLVRWPGQAHRGRSDPHFVSVLDILPTVMSAARRPAPAGIEGHSLEPLLAGKPRAWRKAIFSEFTAHGAAGVYPRRAVRAGRYKLILNLLADQRANPYGDVDGDVAYRESQRKELAGSLASAVFRRMRHPPREELYDLASDPSELRDLSRYPAYAAVLADLRGQLQAWRERTADPLLDEAALAALRRDEPRPATPEPTGREAAVNPSGSKS